jgi:hypothetical protein
MARKNREKRVATTTRGKAKFAGAVVMTPPGGGRTKAVASGTRIVASVAELSVAGLPESGKKSELQLDIQVRTTAGNGKAVSRSWSSGIYYYVPDDSSLGIVDAVIFDGLVHQHLSLDLSLVEREMPQIKLKEAAGLAEAAAEAAAKLTAGSGALGTALEAFPGVLGGILKLNGDDQVLKHTTSLFTKEVNRAADSPQYLVEGRYRFEKKRDPRAKKPWVTLVLDFSVADT